MAYKPDATKSKDTIDKHFWGFVDSTELRRGGYSGLDTGGEVDSVHPEDDSTASEGNDRRLNLQLFKISDSGGEDFGADLTLGRANRIPNGSVEPLYDIPMRTEESTHHHADPKRVKSVTKKNKNSRLRGLVTRGVGKKVQKQGMHMVGHRKRRPSGRVLRTPQHLPSVSEGDMAQADEMGDGGVDDGFVETSEDQPRKKIKKKG